MSARAPTGSVAAWGRRAFGRTREVVHRRAPLLGGVLFWVLAPVVCLLALGVGTARLASHIDNVPAGTRGTYEVTSHSCQRQLCITGGTFRSADGRLVVRDLLGDYRWRLGTRHGVVYNTDAGDVIPLPARWEPAPTVLGMAGALGFLGLWGYLLVRVRRPSSRLSAGPEQERRHARTASVADSVATR